jgi:hypothetical protein
MTITLLSKRDYRILKSIQKKFPLITFQNDGYQYLKGHVKLSQKDKQALDVVSMILVKCIQGFQEFNNFKLRKNGDVVVRIQYKWDSTFTGVGYVAIDQMRHGFSVDEHGPIFFQDDITKESTAQQRLDWIRGLNASGFAGVNSNGTIVDRREFPDAVEVQANTAFGIVEPKTHSFTV